MANSKRRCLYCRDYFPQSEMHDAPVGWFCTYSHLIAYAADKGIKAVNKDRKQQAKAHNAEKRKAKASDLPHQKNLTQRVFNAFIRALDRGKTCPTCDDPLIDGRYDAGHVRTVAACPQLRFDPRACFGQCRNCNGSGTIRKRTRKTQEVVSDLYKAWVLRTMGHDYHAWLYGPHDSQHWTIGDLMAMRKVFAEEIRRIESGQGPSRDWRALA